MMVCRCVDTTRVVSPTQHTRGQVDGHSKKKWLCSTQSFELRLSLRLSRMHARSVEVEEIGREVIQQQATGIIGHICE